MPRRARRLVGLAFAVASIWALTVLPGVDAASASVGSDLQRAPTFQVGQWWSIDIHDLRTDDVRHATIIVASKDNQGYSFGMGSDARDPALMAYHPLPIGRVQPGDLSYDVHGAKFSPLQFPLEADATWNTRIGQDPVTARVSHLEDDQATIDFTVDATGEHVARFVYDGTLRMFRSVTFFGVSQTDVTEHGTGYTCETEVPLESHDYAPASIVPTAAAWPEIVHPQMMSFSVPTDYNRLALAIYVGAETGAAAQAVRAPDGTVVHARADPSSGASHQTVMRLFDEPVGDWRIQGSTAGDGYAVLDGIAYRAVSVRPQPPPGAGPGPCFEDAGPSTPRSAATFPGTSIFPHAATATALVWSVGSGLVLWAVWVRVPGRRWAAWALVPLYAKLSRDDVVSQAARARILDLVRRRPAILSQEIRRELDLGWGTVVYHMALLERHGHVVGATWGRHRHWFDPRLDAHQRALAMVARRPHAERVLHAILREPGRPQNLLAFELGLHHSTIIFHAERLQRLGLVEGRREHGNVRYYPSLATSSPNTAPSGPARSPYPNFV